LYYKHLLPFLSLHVSITVILRHVCSAYVNGMEHKMLIHIMNLGSHVFM